MENTDENKKTTAEDLVVTKYKMAGDIVNRVLIKALARCIAGASLREICIYGDELIVEETKKVFKREKSLKKGIAFPTCISVNNCIWNFSPLLTDPDYVLREEDVVKVTLGAHIDGFIAVVGHTIVIGASKTSKVSGRKADVIMAAHFASEAAVRLIKAGNESSMVTAAVQKVAEAYHCKPIKDSLCCQLKHFLFSLEKTIVLNPSNEYKKQHDEFEFETHDVFEVDIVISTGEGVGSRIDERISIYKKTDETYQLKLKASRMFYSEVAHKYGTIPFNLRYFVEEKKAKLGVTECVNHKLIEPFETLYEKPNEIVAQFKCTVLLMPSGIHRITGLPFEADLYESELCVSNPELKAILSSSANPRAEKKKKRRYAKQERNRLLKFMEQQDI